MPVSNSMFVTPTDSSELGTIIHKLINSKSPGHDNIGPKLIKYIASAIIHPLVYIYNSSLANGMVPDRLKIGKVVPVFKKGDRSLPTNYRPICLLSIFDKLLEKLMYKRLYDFLIMNNILYEYQFGFRKIILNFRVKVAKKCGLSPFFHWTLHLQWHYKMWT